MSIIFSDTFTTASDTPLTSHTPDIGTSWEVFISHATNFFEVRGADVLRSDADTTSSKMAANSAPSPTTADVDVEIAIPSVLGTGTDDPIGLFARAVDNSNYYFILIHQSAADPDIRICKCDAGTISTLASGNMTLANADVIKFELRGITLKLYQNGVERLSVTDSTFSAAGKCGVLMGNFVTSTDDINSTWVMDDYSVTEVPSSGAVIKMVTQAYRAAL